MPRKRRFYLPNVPVHVIQRGHNKQAVFCEDKDYLAYLRFLKEAADGSACLIHAYVLMTNHVHLLVTPMTANAISIMCQHIGRQFVPYINKTYNRHGSLWEGRHKSHSIESETYFLLCMRYIESNPVRAAMVDHPAKYRWSSYATNAHGISNVIINPHECYLALGTTPALRQMVYRGLFENIVKTDELDLIRASLNSGTPLGNDRFKREIENLLGYKVGVVKRGRPTAL